MAKRSGRRGAYLLTDDTLGWTIYANKAQRDYWGNLTSVPLKRNLQEIASPLNDPALVIDFRGPAYEYANPCNLEVAPQYVGLTTIPTNQSNAAFPVLMLNPAIPNMSISCTFIIR